MPIAQVSHAPSRSAYDAVASRLNLDQERPAGLIVHAASETPTGEVQIIDVFESSQAMDSFARERLFPAFQEAGMMEDIAARPQPVAYETFDLVS